MQSGLAPSERVRTDLVPDDKVGAPREVSEREFVTLPQHRLLPAVVLGILGSLRLHTVHVQAGPVVSQRPPHRLQTLFSLALQLCLGGGGGEGGRLHVHVGDITLQCTALMRPIQVKKTVRL